MQGPQVDEALNQEILNDHLRNKPQEGAPYKFLVEGAGPNGLYAALQFFRSGASVSLINDRGEKVVRNQIISLDPKWVAQLNYLMGSKFNELFVGPEALGELDLEWGSANINTKNLEDIMKVRVAEISSYIEDKPGVGENGFLNLHFEAPLTSIRTSGKDFVATIGSPKESQEVGFEKLAIERLEKNILATAYEGRDPTEVLEDGHTTVLGKAREEARAQWDKRQVQAKREQPSVIYFDFLACMGGANDRIRDEFLDPAIPFTTAKSYGIATWIKPESEKSKRYLNQENYDRLGVKRDNYHNPYLTSSQLKDSLKSQKLDDLVASSKLPETFKKKYAKLTDSLLTSIAENRLQDIDPGKEICGVNLRVYENNFTVYIGAATPPLLSDFLHDLDKLTTGASSPKDADQLKALKKEIDKRWMNALGGVFGVNPEVLKLDESPINVGTFDVQQKAVDTAAKLLKSENSSAVIAAFGDSRASPHFFSGSGMSSGRLGVEVGAGLLREFNQTTMRPAAFAQKLNTRLGRVKEKVAQKGSRFIGQNTSSERISARYRILKNKVKEHFDQQRKNKVDLVKTGWKIEDEVNEKEQFHLSFIDKAGEKQTLDVEISSQDGYLHANGEKYPVFNDLLLSLGVV